MSIATILIDYESRIIALHATATQLRLGQTIALGIKLLKAAPVLELSDGAKMRAAERAIAKKAPFHRERNGIADAILMKMYGELVTSKNPGARFAFVTHNTKDFSHPYADNRLPHPDFAPYFSKIKSLYFISLAEALKRLKPALVSDWMLEHD